MNSVNTLWVLLSTILVLFMICGLAFFYSGLVSARNALNTLKMNFVVLAIVPLVWWLLGSSLAFSGNNPYIGNVSNAFFQSINFQDIVGGSDIPLFVLIMFHMMFAAISPAVMSGAAVERMSFGKYCLFVAIWSLAVYSTIAHWVWSDHGWLEALGAIDFAGGIVVHLTAGVSALVLAIMLKPRKYKEQQYRHNVPFVLLGTSMLWFGWFGFNGGSALAVNNIMILAFLNTILATSASILTWMICAWIEDKKTNVVRSAIATVVGLVAITPAAGYVPVWAGIIIGIMAAIVCYLGMKLQARFKHKIDDALDVFVCHGLSGIVGAILTGVFASAALNPNVENGLFYGNYHLVIYQIIAVITVATFAAFMTYLIVKIMTLFGSIRVTEEEEELGLDLAQHGELAYENQKEHFSKQQLVRSLQKQKYTRAMTSKTKVKPRRF